MFLKMIKHSEKSYTVCEREVLLEEIIHSQCRVSLNHFISDSFICFHLFHEVRRADYYNSSVIKLFRKLQKKMFILICLCSWSLAGVFSESVSVMEGESLTLNTGVTEMQHDDLILWTFGPLLIAKINGKDNKREFYDDKFRDRLKLNHQTGSLTITNTRTTDSGLYTVTSSKIKMPLNTFNITVYAHLPVPVISSMSSQNLSSSGSPTFQMFTAVFSGECE
ncbi:uncharacterized protein LOC127157204 [Labeo rohita]|nr:uncharacterized protein LOC127157204 [Labeo rohita]